MCSCSDKQLQTDKGKQVLSLLVSKKLKYHMNIDGFIIALSEVANMS